MPTKKPKNFAPQLKMQLKAFLREFRHLPPREGNREDPGITVVRLEAELRAVGYESAHASTLYSYLGTARRNIVVSQRHFGYIKDRLDDIRENYTGKRSA